MSESQIVNVDDVVKKKKKKQSKSKKTAFEKVLEQMRVKPTNLTVFVGAGGISVVLAAMRFTLRMRTCSKRAAGR